MAEQDSSIPNLDPVNLPLSGAEVFPVSQNGVTKKMRVDEIPSSGGQLNSNELAAVQNANAPSETNPFATIDDLPASGAGTLAETLVLGNTTDGNDINISNGDAVVLANSSKIREGTRAYGYGGGISQVCANDKELQWEDGFLYFYPTIGDNVYCMSMNDVIPDSNYDEDIGWKVGSRLFNLVTGVTYICTQANSGDAIWAIVTIPNYNLFIGVNTLTPTGILADKAAFIAAFDPITNPNLNVINFDLSNGVIRIEVYGLDNFGDAFLANNTEVTSFKCDFDVTTGDEFLLSCIYITTLSFLGNITGNSSLFSSLSLLTSVSFLGNVNVTGTFLRDCTSLTSVFFYGELTTGVGFLQDCTALTKLVAVERNASIIQAETDLGITAFTMVQIPPYSTFNGIPGASQDESLGYQVGFIVQDYNTSIEYRCIDASTTAAVWVQLQGNNSIMGGIVTALTVDGTYITGARFDELFFKINGNIVTVYLKVFVDFSLVVAGQNGWFQPLAIPNTAINGRGIVGTGSFFLGTEPDTSTLYPIVIHNNKAYMVGAGTGLTNVPTMITYSYETSFR
jgi:hypothetical protein